MHTAHPRVDNPPPGPEGRRRRAGVTARGVRRRFELREPAKRLAIITELVRTREYYVPYTFRSGECVSAGPISIIIIVPPETLRDAVRCIPNRSLCRKRFGEVKRVRTILAGLVCFGGRKRGRK